MRSLWTGSISFGLINIPVKLYSAVSDDRIHFEMRHAKDGGHIHYKRVCEKDDKEVEWDDIVKAFEFKSGEYVTFTHEELDELDVDTMRVIDIDTFVRLEDIDPVYYDKTYYLAPAKGGEKAYKLLAEALDKQDRVGIAKFALRQKEHLTALRVMDGRLVAQTMHWPSEIRDPDFEIGDAGRIRAEERKMAGELIDKLTGDFEPDRYRNEFKRKLTAAAKRKSEGKQIVVDKTEPAEEREVDDLMAMLTASIKGSNGRGAKARSKASPKSRSKSFNGSARPRSKEWLLDKTKPELDKLAREKEISGRSGMTKKELVDALRQ